MNDLPRQMLSRIVARHGRSVAGELGRVKGLLRDYCAHHRREIAVLVTAAEEGVAADLMTAGAGLPREALLARLTRRLQDHVAMETAAAKWAVHSWALALGVVSATELDAMEQNTQETPATATVVSTATRAKLLKTTRSFPDEILVSASGDGDFTSICEAINAATPGARLGVRAGTYREGIVLDKLVEISAEMDGGARQDVIIVSAEASCIRMQTKRATVRGLILRQEFNGEGEAFFAVDIPEGRLTLEDCDISSASLSCIGIHNDSADPLIRRCRIRGGADSGVYFFNAARGALEDCDIYDNTNVGVAIAERANPTIQRCRIHDGKNAGVVSWNGGLGVIEECEIFGNSKTNVGVSEEADLTLRRSRIYGGRNSGVFVHNDGQASLEECDIHSHAEPEVAVSRGGKFIARGCNLHESENSGLFVDVDGVAVLEECDLLANSDAGVMVNAEGVAALSHCRINHNGGVAISVNNGGEVIVEDCDLRGNRKGPWDIQRGAMVKELRTQS